MGNISQRDGLDDELAEAAGLGEHSGPLGAVGLGAEVADGMVVPAPSVPHSTATRASQKKGSWGLLLTLLVMAAGLVSLFMFGFKDAAVYSMPVDKLLANQASVGKRVRIDGALVPGTLSRRDKPCEYRFTLRGDGKDLEIRYPQCVVPDTFRDVPQGGVLVTAEGKLLEEGHFEASLLLAKCSSKYDPTTHKMGESTGSASLDAF